MAALLDAGANVDKYGPDALYTALIHGRKDLVTLLLDRGVDFCGNALQAASRNGDEEIVNLLLDKGADVSIQGGHYGNVLQTASYNSHEDIVKLLLGRGADINSQGGHFGVTYPWRRCPVDAKKSQHYTR